ncbi:MAG: glycosyltransferase, partial [Planctomycetota bacterium]
RDPLASVVIPVGPDAEFLGKCLDRVRRQDFKKKEIIIVCDAGAADLASIPEGSEELRVIREREPAELSRLINDGMRAARGHVKVLLMPHCIPVGNGWLRVMVEPFERDEVGVVVSQCFPLERSEPGLAARLLDSVDPPERRAHRGGPSPLRVVSHRCDAYRASLLADIGYFAGNGLAAPGQAIDASIKVADAGYSIVLSEGAVAAYNAPRRRRSLARVLATALEYGRSDAMLDRLYDLSWLNAGVLAAALLSLLLLPVAALSLPVALALSIGLFIWAGFLGLRLPVLGWECPLAVFNFAAYVGVILLIRDDWRPGLFGLQTHPAVIRQWCWLAALAGSNLALVTRLALRGALRSCRSLRGLAYAVPVFVLGMAWWLLAGVGYLGGRLLHSSGHK